MLLSGTQFQCLREMVARSSKSPSTWTPTLWRWPGTQGCHIATSSTTSLTRSGSPVSFLLSLSTSTFYFHFLLSLSTFTFYFHFLLSLYTFTLYFHFLLSLYTFTFYFHFLLSLSTFTFYLPQSGQLSRILRTHMPETKTNCWGEGEFKSMGLNNTIAAFGLVAAAVLLAFLTFMLELLVSRLTAK